MLTVIAEFTDQTGRLAETRLTIWSRQIEGSTVSETVKAQVARFHPGARQIRVSGVHA